MKIVQVSPFFYPVLGGMETHVFEISRRLSKLHDVIVWTSNIDRKGNPLPHIQELEKIKVKRFKILFRVSEFVSFFPGVFKEIKKVNADIIHIHAYRHPHNLLPYLRKIPAIITPHYPIYPFSSLKRKIFSVTFDFLFGKKILEKYTKIVALTEGEKLWLKSRFGIREEKIEVIPNGVSEEYIKKHNPRKFLEYFSLPQDKFIILSVGRLHFSKGFQDLIKAFALLPDNIRRNSLLVIVGPDAGYFFELKRLVNTLGLDKQVIFTGKISEELKLSAYEACDLFVLPSYWEGFGIAIIEAMAKDKIVMARNSGGQKWIIPEEQFLFNSIGDLSNKIKLVYEGKLTKNLDYKKIVEKKYLWNKIVNQLIDVYEEAANNL